MKQYSKWTYRFIANCKELQGISLYIRLHCLQILVCVAFQSNKKAACTFKNKSAGCFELGAGCLFLIPNAIGWLAQINGIVKRGELFGFEGDTNGCANAA